MNAGWAREWRRASSFVKLAILSLALGCAAGYSVRHTVVSGENVAVLAARSGVSEGEIRRMNRLGPADSLRPGDTVLLPSTYPAEPSVAPPPPVQTVPSPQSSAPHPREEKPVAPAETRRRQPEPPPAPPPLRETPKPPAPERPVGTERAPSSNAAPPASLPAAPVPRAAKVRPPAPTPAPTPDRKGSLRWPVEGEIVRGFGKGPTGENLGIDIGAPAGSTVRAAAGGRVIYARAPTKAYGPLVIVDHGGRLHTVYASLKDLAVKRGDSVDPGHALGTVAESTLGPPAHVHFEVRRNGDAVDPLSLLPAR